MTELACATVRESLLAEQRGELPPQAAQALREHLQNCEVCARVAAEERVVSELLRARLTSLTAPAALKARLVARMLAQTPAPVAPPTVKTPRRSRGFIAALTLAACALIAGSWWWSSRAAIADVEPLLQEVVNDHLRVLYAQHPIEIESGGIHQVKPWFSGRIDFAPDISFSGNDEFPLVGGAVGYVLDRKAATFVFKRRLHTITLLVFRADPATWPKESAAVRVGSKLVLVRNLNGFHALLWQAQGLGHALISDVHSADLRELCAKLDRGS